MKVYVLMANAVTDVAGELLDSGGLIGVYATLERAEYIVSNIENTYLRKQYDYTIEEAEVTSASSSKKQRYQTND